MTILLAISDWDPAALDGALARAFPGRPIVTPQTSGDRAAVQYALTWQHSKGALADLPNLKAIFSLGAGVDHMLRRIATARTSRSCASSMWICATG